MEVRIVNKSENQLPKYETEFSSGVDLRSDSEEFTLQPLERRLVKTGLFFEIPKGFEGQVRPRSGLALKRGLTVVNAPGTIDADYRGEVGVVLINLSNEPQIIEKGERIAQLVICPVKQVDFIEVTELTDTDRGSGGFGHTGTN